MVFGIVLLPGMDMAFVLASTLRSGRRAGLLAVAGIMAGAVVHVAASGLGFALLVQSVPSLFNVLLLAGAAYLAWIGVSLVRHASASGAMPGARSADGNWPTFRQALITSLLNPKAYVFMIAVFPQFTRPQDGHVWSQLLVMGLIIWLAQATVYGAVAFASSRAGDALGARPITQQWLARVTGFVLFAGAMYTLTANWRA